MGLRELVMPGCIFGALFSPDSELQNVDYSQWSGEGISSYSTAMWLLLRVLMSIFFTHEFQWLSSWIAGSKVTCHGV